MNYVNSIILSLTNYSPIISPEISLSQSMRWLLALMSCTDQFHHLCSTLARVLFCSENGKTSVFEETRWRRNNWRRERNFWSRSQWKTRTYNQLVSSSINNANVEQQFLCLESNIKCYWLKQFFFDIDWSQNNFALLFLSSHRFIKPIVVLHSESKEAIPFRVWV